MQMIKADQAQQITDGSRNVLVGVLDSGIDPDTRTSPPTSTSPTR